MINCFFQKVYWFHWIIRAGSCIIYHVSQLNIAASQKTFLNRLKKNMHFTNTIKHNKFYSRKLNSETTFGIPSCRHYWVKNMVCKCWLKYFSSKPVSDCGQYYYTSGPLDTARHRLTTTSVNFSSRLRDENILCDFLLGATRGKLF